ncbi:hypothetical protein LJC02_01810 [Breznakia sp. OttesenSCG-928-G09]|nr:hypothetical protein [Breznakia sp. OttesenSCG-928-G09]
MKYKCKKCGNDTFYRITRYGGSKVESFDSNGNKTGVIRDEVGLMGSMNIQCSKCRSQQRKMSKEVKLK